MKIRFFIDNGDEIIGAENNTKLLEVFDDETTPFAYIEVDGVIDDVRIRKSDGTYIFPRKLVQKNDYVMITEWGCSLL